MALGKVRFMRHLGFLLETLLVVPLGTLISFLPWRVGRAFGRFGGALVFSLGKSYIKWAWHNLDIIYAENPLSKKRKLRIVKNLYMNLGTVLFEYLKIGSVTPENYEKFVNIENSEAVERALNEKKGVLAIAAHIGNWEYLGSVGAKLGKNVAAIIYRQRNPYTDRWLKNIREKKGKVTCFYDDITSMPRVLRHLKNNGILGILADETHSLQPIVVPFFGIPSPAAPGAAKIHLRNRTPIVFCFSVKQNDGRYLLSFDGPHHFRKSGDLRKDCEYIMSQINKKCEEIIKKYPDQWFCLLQAGWENRAG